MIAIAIHLCVVFNCVNVFRNIKNAIIDKGQAYLYIRLEPTNPSFLDQRRLNYCTLNDEFYQISPSARSASRCITQCFVATLRMLIHIIKRCRFDEVRVIALLPASEPIVILRGHSESLFKSEQVHQ